MSVCSLIIYMILTRFSLYNNGNVICEKPIVLYPHNIEMLNELEKKLIEKFFNFTTQISSKCKKN